MPNPLGNPLFGRRRPRFLRPQLADADDAALLSLSLSLSLLCRVARRPLNGYKSGRRKQSALVAPEKPRATDGRTDGWVSRRQCRRKGRAGTAALGSPQSGEEDDRRLDHLRPRDQHEHVCPTTTANCCACASPEPRRAGSADIRFTLRPLSNEL